MAALNSRKVTSKNSKRAHDDGDSPRPAEVYGTAVRASTLRFNTSAMNEGIELPQWYLSVLTRRRHGAQVELSVVSMEGTRSVGGRDAKVHPFGDVLSDAGA
uniref:Calcium influx-promoting protein ehs1 n=1 Tax=Ganoderma boninense TaxID=34458 RepID=A0A5K1JTK8_9APHY|nr:Calcium influx-promoting protein ehs1 [Ganoderma boninense]